MDEHGPQPWPQPTYPTQPPELVTPPRRRRRLLATVTATALVAGVGGVGVGYVAANGLHGPSSAGSTTNASGPAQQQPPTTYGGGSGSSGGSGSGGGDGFGDWQGSLPALPSLPYTGGGGTQSDSQSSGTKASGSQLTGLVRIISTMKYSGAKAAGTGMVLTSDGEVVTNHHVVAGSTSLKVKVMSTGQTYAAHVVGTDAKDDVAVLELDGASGLSTVTPDTAGVSVGDAVTAVGDGNGTVGYLSAADGRVMATGQSITTQSEGSAAGERLSGLIEISSDVVPGYSGGATYDADGQVVGMTTAASSGSSDIVGYAVPITKVLNVADDLENGVSKARYDYGSPAFLGVALANGTTVRGVYKGTPAADAGISAGDRITAIGSVDVSTTAQLRAAVASHSPGDSISVTWTGADGASHTATLTLTQGPVK